MFCELILVKTSKHNLCLQNKLSQLQRRNKSLEALATQPNAGIGLSDEVLEAARRAGILQAPAGAQLGSASGERGGPGSGDPEHPEDADEEDVDLGDEVPAELRDALAHANKPGIIRNVQYKLYGSSSFIHL